MYKLAYCIKVKFTFAVLLIFASGAANSWHAAPGRLPRNECSPLVKLSPRRAITYRGWGFHFYKSWDSLIEAEPRRVRWEFGA